MPAYGAPRCAQQLAEDHGLMVHADDINALARAGLLRKADVYKGHPLYDIDTVLALIRDNAELREQLRRQRCVDIGEAAAILEVRRVEVHYLVAGGLIRPVARKDDPSPDDALDVNAGTFLIADLEDLRDDHGIDWETVRGVASGPSPLRELFPALPTRAQRMRELADRLSKDLRVTVTAVWCEKRRRSGVEGWWEFRWIQDDTGRPESREVGRAIRAEARFARYRPAITLVPATGVPGVQRVPAAEGSH